MPGGSEGAAACRCEPCGGAGRRDGPARAQEAADADAEVDDELVDEPLEDVDEEESDEEDDVDDELESEPPPEPESELVDPDSPDDAAGACEPPELPLPERESFR